MIGRLARAALGLYPLAFRRRYEQEMEAVLEQSPVRPSTVLDLLRGAAKAHLRPPAAVADRVGPGDRVRASASGVLACWVAFAAAGFAFYKTTEDHRFESAGHAHPVLGFAHLGVQALAVLGSLAVVLGASPLILAALAAARRDRSLRAWTAVPPLAVAVFAGLTAILVGIARANGSHGPTVGGGIAFIAWGIAGLGCGAACVVGARKVLFAMPPERRSLLAAFAGAAVATAAMAGMTVAVALYAVALPIDATHLSGAANGPLQAVSASASVIAATVVMAVATALAETATYRGWHAAAQLRAGNALSL